MVWKLGKLHSAYNELRFNAGTVLPCTNLLFFAYKYLNSTVERLIPKRCYWIILQVSRPYLDRLRLSVLACQKPDQVKVIKMNRRLFYNAHV